MISKKLKNLLNSNQLSGIILISCVLVSLLIANSPFGSSFQNLLDSLVGPYSISVWVNDGLMAIFFLLIGLEIKREVLEGELSSIKNASLPIVAAIGGIVVPALIFTVFNYGTPYAKGWGIPMATDIAFSLTVISMLGKKVPVSLKIFLTALAIVDDLGAILVIAIFYTEQIHWLYLLYSALVIGVLVILNKMKVKNLACYLIPGIFLWYFMHHSGIHATIAGVLLAFTIPTNKSKNIPSPLEKLEHTLHIPVSYIIMPIFALSNTNIAFNSEMVNGLFTSLGYGIVLGLVLGKMIGINLFSFVAIKLGWSTLPTDSKWPQMFGVGLLGGIGFTMSIFIAILSFKGSVEIQDKAKFAILIASVLAGVLGYWILKNFSTNKKEVI